MDLKPEIDEQIKQISKVVVGQDIDVVITLKSTGEVMWKIPTDLKVASYLVRILNLALDDMLKSTLKPPKESKFIGRLLGIRG